MVNASIFQKYSESIDKCIVDMIILRYISLTNTAILPLPILVQLMHQYWSGLCTDTGPGIVVTNTARTLSQFLLRGDIRNILYYVFAVM